MESETKIIYYEDGSYLIETIDISVTRASGSKSASKNKTYYGSDGVARWQATLSGSFTYDGSSATCTSSSCSVSIYDSAWYTVSKTASKSGPSANASVTMGEKLLGITVNKVSANITLTCDGSGNLS